MGLDLDILVSIPDVVQLGHPGIWRDGVLAFFVGLPNCVEDTYANNPQSQSLSLDCVLHPRNLHQRRWHRATRNWVYILASTGSICRLHQWSCQDLCRGWDIICRDRDVGLSFFGVGVVLTILGLESRRENRIIHAKQSRGQSSKFSGAF